MPAESEAVAVQTLVTFEVTFGAVNIPPAKLPPFVQSTFGPEVIPTLSLAARAESPVAEDVTSKTGGSNETTGGVVSMDPVGGGVDVESELLDPPPHEASRNADSANGNMFLLKFIETPFKS